MGELEASVTLLQRAQACWATPDPNRKVELAQRLVREGNQEAVLPLAEVQFPALPADLLPGAPDQPRLVDPSQLSKRGLGTERGRAAFIHALAHIEFTAINLALDAVCRFPGLPGAYYRDWLRVAGEEATHFQLLRVHLQSLGCEYGDFDAHAGLWEVADQTKHDVLARMALVPRVLEARGLDVSPGMIERLTTIGDVDGAAILTRIAADETKHVAIGSHWFNAICNARRLAPEQTFIALVREHFPGALRHPFNRAARAQAGFSETELDLLEQQL